MTGRRPRRWLGLAAGLIGGAVVAALFTVLVVWRAPDLDAADLRAFYATPASRFVEVEPGLSVHVRDEGRRDGPVLLLLHGSNSSLQTWEPWVARLKGRYRLVSLDLPGHGLTGAHPRRAYAVGDFVAVVDGVRAKLGIARMAIAGNSMGGWVAWNYALGHPRRTAALILIDAVGAPGTGPPPGRGFSLARTPVLRDLALVILPRFVIERALRGSYGNPALVDDAEIDRYWYLLRYPGNRQATLDRADTPRAPTDPAQLAAIRAPTLVMWGAEDRLIPVRNAAFFVRTIPGAALKVYPGVGHLPMEEAPDATARDAAAFLSAAGAG